MRPSFGGGIMYGVGLGILAGFLFTVIGNRITFNRDKQNIDLSDDQDE